MSWAYSSGSLEIDVDELLVLRRRLSLRSEWLRDRLRLWSLAAGHGGDAFPRGDLALALDGRMTEAEALELLAGELAQAGLAEPDGRTGWHLW